jgi:hypothetical protein
VKQLKMLKIFHFLCTFTLIALASSASIEHQLSTHKGKPPQSTLLTKLVEVKSEQLDDFLGQLAKTKCPENHVLCGSQAELNASNTYHNRRLRDTVEPFRQAHEMAKWFAEAISTYDTLISKHRISHS